MQAKSSTDETFGARLKSWGKQQFKSLAKLADALDISPQHLSAYFSGARKPTLETLTEFYRMGADLNFLIGGKSEIASCPPLPDDSPSIKTAALILMERAGRSPEDLAEDVEASPRQVRAWMNGKSQPSHRQLALLFNELAKTAATLAAVRGGCGMEGLGPDLQTGTDGPK